MTSELRTLSSELHQFCVRVLEMAADRLKQGGDATLGWGALAASLKATLGAPCWLRIIQRAWS
eukprot:COSAG04_NODE_450_length_14158_cov_17.389573_13_plen_63_part_00